MTIKFLKRLSLAFSLFCFFTLSFAETITDETFGFSLDIPEGYELTASTDDNMSLAFTHKNLPVTLAIKIYESEEDSIKVLQNAIEKLGSKDKASFFEWNESICSVSKVKFNVEQDFAGWAVCAPTMRQGYFVVLVCYSPESISQKCEFFIISTINSLKVGDSKTTGIFSTLAYPPSEKKEVILNIAGKKVKTTLDKSDREASEFVINLEFNVLNMYAKHPLAIQAWKRYYRILQRDAQARLSETAQTIYKTLYPEAKKQNPQNPELGYAQLLLSWVQGFSYEHTDACETSKLNSDFTALPAMLEGEGNDCDSRSMLLSVLLSEKDIPCTVLFSPEYAHALAAVKIDAPGQTFINPSTNEVYLMGETTAKVTWGTIAQDHMDRTKWFAIDSE